MTGASPVRLELRADCSECVALCCIEPAFTASADFAISKPARTPCPHLQDDSRCEIHETLPERGFPGCAVFDCFGAGQRLTRSAFGGGSRQDESGRPAGPVPDHVLAAFPVLRQLHELLWHLSWARAELSPTEGQDEELVADVARQLAEVDRLTGLDGAELPGLDVAGLRRTAGALLDRVSTALRAHVHEPGPDRRGADLLGRDLRRKRLRGASLRGAYLIGADLRGVDLTATDLLGADLRATDLRGAQLAGALFLTQPQLDAARGDDATTLPPRLQHPRRWISQPGPADRSRRASINAKRPSGSSRSLPNSSRS